MVGQNLAHYRVLQKVGEGGMGVVFRARDTHLDRLVAIKVLPAERVGDPDRTRRFVQEARAASALSHPNIVTVYDIDSDAGVMYMAMEYVAGKPLDEVLSRKGLRLREALGYAIQIADALAAAHAAGIVHRDLKPSNIMIGDDGRVRVLDFGLAKLVVVSEAADAGPTATAAPISEAGTVVGTFAYMSPEQAEGKTVDARSDIFSFGVLLYEMLTGHHPFRRDSQISTLAAILNEEPGPPSQEGAGLPADVDRVVTRCLRKDPQRRWQSMSDVKSVLEDLKDESDSGTLGPAAAGAAGHRRPRASWALATIAIVLVAVLGVFLGTWDRGPAGSPELKLTPLTFDTGFSGFSSVSRDGKIVAYSSDRSGEGPLDIWVRHVDRPHSVRRTHDPVGASEPSVSPDGSRIVYSSARDGGGLFILDTLGGDARRLVAHGSRPRFSPDGRSILYTLRAAGDEAENKTFVISPDGSEPRRLHAGYIAAPDPAGVGPIWSPDSRRVLFNGTRRSDHVAGWWVAQVEGGAVDPVDVTALPERAHSLRFPAAWPWEDTLLFAEGVTIEGINLFRIHMASDPYRLSGPARRLTSGPGLRLDPSVSADGRLVFSILTWVSNLWSVRLDADTGRASGEPQAVTSDRNTKHGASVTPDGSKAVYAAFAERRPGQGTWRIDLRLRDIPSGRETVLSSGPLMAKQPRISPDGALVAYREATPDGEAAFIATASDERRRVCLGCRILGFFPDADEVLVLDADNRLVRLRVSTGGQKVVFAPTETSVDDARLSVDGRWIAVTLHRPGGRAGLYVVPVGQAAAPDEARRTVEESDTARLADPCWSPDGDVLYYLSGRDGALCIWARRFDPQTGSFTDESYAVLHLHSPRLSMLGGGRWDWGLNATRDRLYLLMSQTSGNVWSATLPR